jgi:hypothetical protein
MYFCVYSARFFSSLAITVRCVVHKENIIRYNTFCRCMAVKSNQNKKNKKSQNHAFVTEIHNEYYKLM